MRKLYLGCLGLGLLVSASGPLGAAVPREIVSPADGSPRATSDADVAAAGQANRVVARFAAPEVERVTNGQPRGQKLVQPVKDDARRTSGFELSARVLRITSPHEGASAGRPATTTASDVRNQLAPAATQRVTSQTETASHFVAPAAATIDRAGVETSTPTGQRPDSAVEPRG